MTTMTDAGKTRAQQLGRPDPRRPAGWPGLMEGDGSDAPQTTWGEKVTDAVYQAPRTSTR